MKKTIDRLRSTESCCLAGLGRVQQDLWSRLTILHRDKSCKGTTHILAKDLHKNLIDAHDLCL